MNEWWESQPGVTRFECTMCGRCCSGPEGFVLITDADVTAMSAHLGLTEGEFIFRYTRMTPRGRSLRDVQTRFGQDCIFLDRQSVEGRALCRLYEHRPAQCRTWPFWRSNLSSPQAWDRARAVCPGIGRGEPRTPQQVRILRDQVDI